MKKEKVVIGLSGGVDSSVAAYVLKQQGYEVIGLFMRNWTDTTGVLEADCPWLDDRFDAQAVAMKLEIPFHFVDLSAEYKERVVEYMFSEYEQGRTPNPDVLCNREIKFDAFMKEALKLGADYVATGHYCRKETEEKEGQEIHKLFAGEDGNKDQSYFLCQLNQKQLEKAMFPIGDLKKPEVRKIARELNLATAHKKDSQGICFIGHVDLPVFLQQKLKAKKGNVIQIFPDAPCYKSKNLQGLSNKERLELLSQPFDYTQVKGKKVGQHNGAQFYTIGQRKGLNIGGFPEPIFVISTDTKDNVIYVGMGKEHPGLFRSALHILPNDIHWVRPDLAMEDGEVREYLVRIRYRQPLQKAQLYKLDGNLFIEFEDPQRSITAGQFAAWYDKDELVGSGVIDK